MLDFKYIDILTNAKILINQDFKYKFTEKGIAVFEEIKKIFSLSIEELRSHPITRAVLTKDHSIRNRNNNNNNNKKQVEKDNQLSPADEFRELQHGYSDDLY
jgi:hypothetical protein